MPISASSRPPLNEAWASHRPFESQVEVVRYQNGHRRESDPLPSNLRAAYENRWCGGIPLAFGLDFFAAQVMTTPFVSRRSLGLCRRRSASNASWYKNTGSAPLRQQFFEFLFDRFLLRGVRFGDTRWRGRPHLDLRPSLGPASAGQPKYFSKDSVDHPDRCPRCATTNVPP